MVGGACCGGGGGCSSGGGGCGGVTPRLATALAALTGVGGALPVANLPSNRHVRQKKQTSKTRETSTSSSESDMVMTDTAGEGVSSMVIVG